MALFDHHHILIIPQSLKLLPYSGPALDTIDVCDGTGVPKSGGAQEALKLEDPQALAVKFLYDLQTGGGVVVVLGNF